MLLPLHRFTTLVNAIEEKQAETHILKAKLQELISTGTFWARILHRASEGQDLHRIGMVTGVMTDNGKLLLMVHILMRSGPAEDRGYLWGDASWTRHYRDVNDLEVFTLENKGGRIQVPRMEFQGSIDGPCVVFPEKWIWHGCYAGPKLSEGERLPRDEVGVGDPAPEGE
jgi:hypothetical protein